jgi:hypothetical protein
LFELDERDNAMVEIDCNDRGNVATRLVHATSETAALERFADSIARIIAILPNCEVAALSAAELAFRWRGLEFARARMGAEVATFRSKQEIVFGVGAEERVLEGRNWTSFEQLLSAIRDTRHPYGPRQHPLLYLVAPALHVHPATDILLRYLSPEIDWEFAGIDERWREGVKVVFRKRPEFRARRGDTNPQESPDSKYRIAI